MKSHTAFNYSKITDQIFIGTNQCCKLHFDEKLLSQGITADISLEDESLDTPYGVNYFLWLPTKNHHAPSEQQLLLGAVTIDLLTELGSKVYVHCQNGHGRAPTLVAAYFISQGGSVKEAINLIKTKRPEIHLTKEQLHALEHFEKSEIEKEPCC
ncbi:MAG: dual specificity protein phosphatase family protein [Candidatus Woykebacteria bacterium]